MCTPSCPVGQHATNNQSYAELCPYKATQQSLYIQVGGAVCIVVMIIVIATGESPIMFLVVTLGIKAINTYLNTCHRFSSY